MEIINIVQKKNDKDKCTTIQVNQTSKPITTTIIVDNLVKDVEVKPIEIVHSVQNSEALCEIVEIKETNEECIPEHTHSIGDIRGLSKELDTIKNSSIGSGGIFSNLKGFLKFTNPQGNLNNINYLPEDVEGKSINFVLNELLFPNTVPDYIVPSIVNTIASFVYERDSVLSIYVKPTIKAPHSSIVFIKDSYSNTEVTNGANININTSSDVIISIIGSFYPNPNYTITANDGNEYNATQFKGASNTAFTSTSSKLTFVDPMFVGSYKGNLTTEDCVRYLTKLVQTKSYLNREFFIKKANSVADNEYIVIAYPVIYGDLKSIKYKEAAFTEVLPTFKRIVQNYSNIGGRLVSYYLYYAPNIYNERDVTYILDI